MMERENLGAAARRVKRRSIQMDERTFFGLFEQAGPVDCLAGGSCDLKLIVPRGMGFEVFEGDAVGTDDQTGAKHTDDFSLADVGQRNDAVDILVAGYL